MKSFVILDKEAGTKEAIGYLFYYRKAKAFIIELSEGLTEWDAPLLFQGLVKKKKYTVPRDIAMLWVRERIIPVSRQNIGSILKNERLREYDEMAFLRITSGKCSQDSLSIKEISFDDVPCEIKRRLEGNVSECFATEDGQIICVFRDGSVRKIDPSKLTHIYKKLAYLHDNGSLLRFVSVGVGGYSIILGGAVEIDTNVLREMGELLPVSYNDFLSFARTSLVDTAQACEMLQCSRQNLSYLVKSGQLGPVRCSGRETLYTKGAVEAVMNDG